jgi:hypothetical protein
MAFSPHRGEEKQKKDDDLIDLIIAFVSNPTIRFSFS